MKRAGVCLVLLLASGCSHIPGTNQYLYAQAQEKVGNRLNDADSARYRALQVVDAGICGEVNPKNNFGAYTGYTKFFVSKKDEVSIVTDSHAYPDLEQRNIAAIANVEVATYCGRSTPV